MRVADERVGIFSERAIRGRWLASLTAAVMALGTWAYAEASGPPNPKPNVIPSIKQWIPGTGTYVLSPASRICLATRHADTLSAAAGAFQQDLRSFFGVNLTIVRTDTPGSGDIFLTLDSTDEDDLGTDDFGTDDPGTDDLGTDDLGMGGLGREGYIADISDTVILRANSPRGLFYGTRTLLQLLRQDVSNDHIGQGTIKDFPKYPVRGFMIDVGRMPISMSWLRAYVKFMSYYKMGDLHIHLNDNFIKRPEAYVGFRLESTTYPGLASSDLAYSKKEYAELHALAETYGVTIISEFDTPAHSGAFTRYRPDLRHPALAPDHLDLGNPDIYPFMNALWDEYAGIFDQVHIGTDEYNGGDPDDMRRYINHYNRYLKAKGLGPVRLWGSMASFGGAGGLDRDMLVHIWSRDYYSASAAIRDGYDIINTSSWWYIVPEAGYPYFHDRLDPRLVYDKYEVWDITTIDKVDKNHPQLKGATFCVWNDVWYTKRYSEMAIHDRVREPMKAFSQKMWAASTELDYPTFEALMKTLGEGPGVF